MPTKNCKWSMLKCAKHFQQGHKTTRRLRTKLDINLSVQPSIHPLTKIKLPLILHSGCQGGEAYLV